MHNFKDLLRTEIKVEEKNGIPFFFSKDKIEIEKDKYENIQSNIDFYTGIIAFGHKFLNDGASEGLYQTVNSIILKNLNTNKSNFILDVGCGIGRTIYDLAEIYNKSYFIGFDFSFNMIERAKKILIDGGLLKIDLKRRGFDIMTLDCKKLNNVQLCQGDVTELPFKKNIFDCVVNTYLIDRVTNIDRAIEQMVLTLKPGGLFLLTTPLSFQEARHWESQNPKNILQKIKASGIEDLNWFDNLIYKEIKDARGNFETWNTLVIWGRKKKHN
jgi:ubiquinone/menaquinone biosynthesis C-methylase UbiE